jgi:hypothetical protein
VVPPGGSRVRFYKLLRRLEDLILGRKVYKVFRRYPNIDSLASACTSGRALTAYYPGDWTTSPKWLRARGYYPTAFTTPSKAGEFQVIVVNSYKQHTLKDDRYFEVWECRARGIITELPEFCTLVYMSSGEFFFSRLYSWPEGTVMCKRIKPVRRI